MLRVLLKKQVAEVFRGYIYNRKKGQPRSKGNMILLFLLFGFLMIGVLGGTFTMMAIGICDPLASVGMGWLYYSLMCGIAIILGAFGSVFNTFAGLYLPKDNDLLLSMPIPVRTIIISRLLNVYLLGTMYSGIVMIPTIAVYWATVGVTAANIICGILLFLVISLIVLFLSCLLGWVVARISVKLKNKSFITVLISLLFVGAYYFVYFKAQDMIRELVLNAAIYGAEIRDSAYVLYRFGRIGEGDYAAAAIFTAAAAALVALSVFVLSCGFLKLASPGNNATKTIYREKAVREHSVFSALFMKELGRFTSSPNYMLNCGLGVLLIPALGVFLLIKGSEILGMIGLFFASKPGFTGILLCAMLMLLSTMNDMAAPSVSLEGKSLWIPQSLPVEPKTVLKAKASVQLILTGIPMLFAAICAAIVANASLPETLLICLVPMLYTVFSSLFGTVAGVKSPMLEWTSDLYPIKQSGSVALALFGGWGFVALFAVPYYFFGYQIGLSLYLLIWSAVYLFASAALYRWLNTKGADTFSKL